MEHHGTPAGNALRPPIARAETVGSLLRPPWLLEARRALDEGTITPEGLRVVEDRAVLEAIRLQESVGLDVITDGELRRRGWAVTTEALDGFEPREGGPGLVWHDGDQDAQATRPTAGYPTVVRPIRPRRDLLADYRYLRGQARRRTKFTLPAPSYHRRFWYPEHSMGAYPTAEEFLTAIRDFERTLVVELVGLGCDYVQLDAPNYGTLCDAGNRRMLEARGHDLAAELDFDVALDNSLLEGFRGVTRALHICRGNAAGRWHSSGGYETIAARMFPKLDFDVVLLEYDSDRAGGFGPLALLPEQTVAVLGLVTTKSGGLEDQATVQARLAEAAAIKPLEELAISTQCGFASVAAGNPLTAEEQQAKLELVVRVARQVWTEPAVVP
jgi:5-methyltetrahydropteroyltriglutamate--homocysteine methyltransferase